MSIVRSSTQTQLKHSISNDFWELACKRLACASLLPSKFHSHILSPLQPPSTIFSVHYRHDGPYAAEALASKLALWHEETLVTLRNQLFSPLLSWTTWASASNPRLRITPLHHGYLAEESAGDFQLFFFFVFFVAKEESGKSGEREGGR